MIYDDLYIKSSCGFRFVDSQNKLDEALLTSGRVADALSSLLEWLTKAEASLAEDQPILGDLDTIHMLIEQHKVCTPVFSQYTQDTCSIKGMLSFNEKCVVFHTRHCVSVLYTGVRSGVFSRSTYIT